MPPRTAPLPRPSRPGNGDGGACRAGVQAAVVLAAFALLAVLAPGCGLFSKRVDVLLIGDSIMSQSGQFVESYLVDEPNVGSVSTHTEAINGSGLLTPKLCGQCDWVARAPDLIDTYKPDVVVVLFIGNYSDDTLWTGPDGQPVPNDYGDRFFAAWSAQAEKLNAELSAQGAQVDWVLPPPLAGDEGHRREEEMRKTYQALQQRVPAIGLVDAKTSLGGPNGEWVWRRAGVDGGEVTVRQGDSVHLTDDGGRLLAHQIAQSVAPQLVAKRAKAA